MPQFHQLVLFLLSLYHLLPLLLQIRREFVEHSLQKLASKQSLTSPTSGQSYLLQVESVRRNIVNSQMNVFIVVFLVEELLVKPLCKAIKGVIRVLSAPYQKLPLSYSSLLDRRVDLYINYGEISLKGLVKPFLPHCYTYQIIAVAPFIIGSYLHYPHFSIFGAYNLHFHALINTFVYYLEGRLINHPFRPW